ncbi:hypothetical protein O9992_19040 [Vibrio lentus]|nr:hypothetical protein [Vibrio lentus]
MQFIDEGIEGMRQLSKFIVAFGVHAHCSCKSLSPLAIDSIITFIALIRASMFLTPNEHQQQESSAT